MSRDPSGEAVTDADRLDAYADELEREGDPGTAEFVRHAAQLARARAEALRGKGSEPPQDAQEERQW